jgi:spermidine synthase
MLTHMAMFAHPSPKRVLIIGGGDGGTLREVLRHPEVEEAHLVDIDGEVIRVSRQYFPDVAAALDHPKARVIVDDGVAFVERAVANREQYDLILVDSTDPIGPAEVLFSHTFYDLCRKALNPGGVIALQGGVPFLQPDEAPGVMKLLRGLGLKSRVYLAAVPTYYGSSMSLGYASDDLTAMTPDLENIRARFARSGVETRHYTPELHVASFALPRWLEDTTGGLA